jgi:methylenetetrahydrofolate reductase (NADPH)
MDKTAAAQGAAAETVKSEYTSGSTLERMLARGEFAVTAELGPPKSIDIGVIKEKAKHLAGCVDAVNITDNQTAIVRMSSIAAGLLAMSEGLEPLIQITCRDRNRIAIQSDVLGAAALGIKNILCLSGDHQKFGNHPTAKNVYDMDSIQLIQMLADMRDKKIFACGDEIRNGKNEPVAEPRIYIGGAENPFGDPFEFRVIRLAKKAAAGAQFIQTQCIYDMDRFEEWMRQVRARGLHKKIKILAGVTPLKSVGMAKYMRDSVAGLTVPEYYIERLSKVAEVDKKLVAEEGIKICVEQIHRLRAIEGVAGIHLMAIEWEHKVREIVDRAGLLPRPAV